MTKNKDPNKESLAEIAVDPDVLARELALEIEIDPLEQIDEDVFSKDLNITQECDEALKMHLHQLVLKDLFQPLKPILLPKHLDQLRFQIGFLY